MNDPDYSQSDGTEETYVPSDVKERKRSLNLWNKVVGLLGY